MSGRARTAVALCATVAVLAPIGWLWWGSLVPDSYSVMGMGYVDAGGGPQAPGHAGHGDEDGGWDGPPPQPGDVSVATLTGPQAGTPDVSLTLEARRERFELDDGRQVDGYTIGNSSPGPTIEARQGDLVEVTLVNVDVPDGTTLHWHGVDVPGAEDGVAGVTQDAVPPGGRHTYRFVAEDAGTFWYHSHQVSHEQVRKGLFGALVVRPRDPVADLDVVAAVHTYDGRRTVNGSSGEQRYAAAPGATARVRVVNTDNGELRTWVDGSPYRVVAVDGREVNQPADVEDRWVMVAAGGRVDLQITVPDGGARVALGGDTAVVVGPGESATPRATRPEDELDLLAYGSPAPIGFDPERVDRSFEYRIGRRPGFVDGRPGLQWTVNGKLFPDVPMFLVAEGDVVRMTISNSSGQAHPMHLHGHHAVVLSRDGKASTGSPWWTDSLEVRDGETFEIALLADNPGIWMDHCHNLPHAQQGLVAHLAYAGVSEPFRVGGGAAANAPE